MRFHRLEEHPILSMDESEINRVLDRDEEFSRDEALERFQEIIVEFEDLYLCRISYPFGSRGFYIFDRGTGEGLMIPTDEMNFHDFKNLMAEAVEELGDCRNSEMEDEGVMPSGSIKMRCKGCGGKWDVE